MANEALSAYLTALPFLMPNTNSFLASKLTGDFQLKAGKALRSQVPFDALLQTRPKFKRPNPIKILQAQNATRIPKLVPVRHARMAESPFAFFRGSAGIMAADLNGQPHTNILVQACGDMHVSNFGLFASAERQLTFAINDFDETHIAPWEWDIKRLVASAHIAAEHLGGKPSHCANAVMGCVLSYQKWIRRFSQMGHLEIWYSSIGEKEIISSLSNDATSMAKDVFSKARQRTHMQVLDKLGDVIDDTYHIRENYPFIYHDPVTINNTPATELLDELLVQYLSSLPPERRSLLAKYTLRDVVRKVVGVGSVGTSCWMLYLEGDGHADPLFLQFKEAQRSVLEAYTQPCLYANQGERVVYGQRLIQGSPDIFLGFGKLEDMDFYIRQLRDMKGGFELEPGKMSLKQLPQYTALCGHALALAHAKSGNAPIIAGYLGKSEKFAEVMVSYAAAYARQNQSDYDAFLTAIENGKLEMADKAR